MSDMFVAPPGLSQYIIEESKPTFRRWFFWRPTGSMFLSVMIKTLGCVGLLWFICGLLGVKVPVEAILILLVAFDLKMFRDVMTYQRQYMTNYVAHLAINEPNKYLALLFETDNELYMHLTNTQVFSQEFKFIYLKNRGTNEEPQYEGILRMLMTPGMVVREYPRFPSEKELATFTAIQMIYHNRERMGFQLEHGDLLYLEGYDEAYNLDPEKIESTILPIDNADFEMRTTYHEDN